MFLFPTRSVPSLQQLLIPRALGAGRFEVAVRAMFLKAGVFDAQNLVTIPEARFIRRVGVLRAEDLKSVEELVRAWLGLQ